jgi:hypothetical protein
MLPLNAAAARPTPAMGVRLARYWLPRPLRLGLSRVRAEAVSLQTRRELGRLAASGRPIVLGPWFGEVGFELLYWVPFVSWFAHRFGVPPERLVAVSRGGPASWYRGIAGRYLDVFEFVDPGEFRGRNDDRARALGEQKQVAITSLDLEIGEAARRSIGEPCELLHPSTMYRVMAPFWWGHVGSRWVQRHARYGRLAAPAVSPALPPAYTAVKFYFNDCFPPTADNRAFVGGIVRDLAQRGPVVSLSTGLVLDDHAAADDEVVAGVTVTRPFAARTNLETQTQIVAGAQRFVGTYGGFAYLAPLCGVEARVYYSKAGAFSERHLDVARMALRTLGAPDDLLDVQPIREAGAAPR